MARILRQAPECGSPLVRHNPEEWTACRQLLNELLQLRLMAEDSQREQLVDLIVDTASQIAGVALQDVDIWRARVAALLPDLHRGSRCVLRVHPEDLARLREALPTLQAANPALKPIELQADASLQPGDALLDVDSELIDARLATRAASLRRVLRDSLAHPDKGVRVWADQNRSGASQGPQTPMATESRTSRNSPGEPAM